MRWLVLALVVACAPKENPEDKRVPPKQPRFAVDAFVPTYSDDPPWDASVVDAAVVETGAVTIRPPRFNGSASPSGVLAIARVANGYRKVDVAALAVTDDAVQIPAGEPIEIADIARAATPAGVLVIADGTSTVDPELGFALANECWTFASIETGALVGLWPKPCPSETPAGKPQVALVVGTSTHELGVTVPRDVVVEKLEVVTEHLVRYKTRPDFAKRTDLVYTTQDGVTIAALLPVLSAVQATGFTGTRWVPPPWIPMRMPSGAGFEPPPPPPPNIGRIMQPGPPRPMPTQVTVTVGNATVKSPLVADEVDRVVRARAGIWRACYQKELNRTPGIQGTLNLLVDVGPSGEVTKAAATGSLRNEAVDACIRGNFMRLKFPPKGEVGRFKVSLTFRSS